MVRRQRCLQLEAMHSGYGYPRSHPITLKTEKIVILAQLKFVYCTVVCYSPVDNFQVLSIGYNIFKITSLPILRNLHSNPSSPNTHMHTHTHTQIHTGVAIFAILLQCWTIIGSCVYFMLHSSASLFPSEETEAENG